MAYGMTDDGIFRDGERLTNFQCTITKQIKKHDGRKSETWLVIDGTLKNEALPQLTIAATNFSTFNWLPQQWGVTPIIYPLTNVEKDLRCAIQELSDPETLNLYTHTGWSQINGRPTYIHGGGGITATGNHPEIKVELPHDLRFYRLEKPEKNKSKHAFRASVHLATIGPPDIAWPILLTAYRAAVDETDFGVHLSGRTGTFKSEFCSLAQSHFGSGMDARHLPGSWSSTANALEAQAYCAKDAVMVIDDFVPNGTTWQVRGLQKTADQLLRGQGNQAGRARLTDTSSLQTTFYPRGIILSTGEDVPQGHSIRARMLIMDLTPGDITPKNLTAAQDRRPQYPIAMFLWVQHLATDIVAIRQRIQERAKTFRDEHRDLGHARTPQMIGQLQATLEELLRWGMEEKFITTEEAARLATAAEDGLLKAAEKQLDYLKETDPADGFIEILKQLLGAHLCHIRSKSGGIPDEPLTKGWTAQHTAGGTPGFKASGPTLGWQDEHELFVDQNQFPFITKHSGGKLSVTRQTLLKRLKDAGILSRTDELRSRNTLRVMCGGTQRSVITIPLTKVFGEDENG